MDTLRCLSTLALLLFFTPLLFAAEPSGPLLSLTVQDAIKIALQQNPDVLNNRKKIEESEHNIKFTFAQILPNISATGSYFAQKASVVDVTTAPFGGDPYNNYTAQVKLTQPLYQGGALKAGYDASKKEKEVRTYDLEILERDTTVQVIESFYTVLLNRQIVDTLKQTKQVIEQAVATNQKYYRVGRAQKLDVLQAKTNLALLIPQITTAENQIIDAASQLMTLLHEPQSKRIDLVGPIAYIEPQKVMAFLNKKKVLPEITRGETQISEFEDTMTVTLSTHLPTLNLQSTYGRQAFTQSDFFSTYANNWTIGFNLTVPLFSGLSSFSQRAVLRAQEAELEYGQIKLLDQLSYNQIQAERNLDTTATVLNSSREASDLSKASLKEAQRDFGLQTINYLQYLTSQQNYFVAEISFATAKYNYIDAVAKYFVASGIPISNLVDLLKAK